MSTTNVSDREAAHAAGEAARQVLRERAVMRSRDVARGLESARLAGLIIQHEGYGMIELLAAMFGRGCCSFGVGDVDAIVETVDPAWRSHQAQRWSAVADIDLSRPRSTDQLPGA